MSTALMPAAFLGHGSPMNALASAGKPAQVLVDGYAYGSLSMTSYTLDARVPSQTVRVGVDDGGAAPLDTMLPPEDANT